MLLHRTRAGLSQHHLNRSMRMHNLEGAFHAAPAPHTSIQSKAAVWLIDDILTTGVTALAAQQALDKGGHSVRGIHCLGRTPAKRHGRGFKIVRSRKRYAGIAQLVEQATENRRVPSSNLGPGTIQTLKI